MFASVIIYAKRFEDLPIVRNIGDIIRIHRANMKQYQEIKQFHVNVYYNSSWCLFSCKEETNVEEEMSDDEEKEREEVEDQEMEDDGKYLMILILLL